MPMEVSACKSVRLKEIYFFGIRGALGDTKLNSDMFIQLPHETTTI